MNRLEGKNAIITGAIGGLASVQARVLASEGANIVVNYLKTNSFETQAKLLVDELIKKYGGNHIALPADVSIESDVQKMVIQAVEHYGTVDILVNAAGISINSLTWNYTKSDWDKVLGVNLTGVFLCMKAVLPYMREKKYGRIINISSVVGLSGARGTAAYAATKAGVIGLSKTVAKEVARKNITVNCIAPGYINAGIMDDVPEKFKRESVVPFIPMGKLGEADDIAKAVLYLSSDDAKYVTGEVIRVDGGFSM